MPYCAAGGTYWISLRTPVSHKPYVKTTARTCGISKITTMYVRSWDTITLCSLPTCSQLWNISLHCTTRLRELVARFTIVLSVLFKDALGELLRSANAFFEFG